MKATSFSSNLLHSRKMGWPTWAILALITFLSVASYLLFSAVYYRVGFPLDDAWIHQTYARNLALHAEWAFTPGKPSGGSTSPLWSALLAVGFLLRLAPYLWTYILGSTALWGIALLSEKILRAMVPVYRAHFPWIGAAIAFEWHLVWAAVSGMETLPFTLLVIAVLWLVISGSHQYFRLGLLIGLALWIRPDGITLLGPAILTLLLCQFDWTARLRSLINLGLGFTSPFALYLLFNLAISGNPWPNTFYAKQAEYAVYLNLPFLVRLGNEALQPLVGVGLVLLPGMIYMIFSAIQRRAWSILASALWGVGYLILYAWRLPVTYQHGRYVMPSMPIFFLLGLGGLIGLVPSIGRRLPNFWRLTTGAVLIAFWGIGAFTYARDVAVIESEMVATAKWVSANIPIKTLVAAHDIGALGFFGSHEVIDLAGLITPEVIPFLRDEKQIANYLTMHQVGYLVVFPDWYPSLTASLIPVFSTNAPYAPALGEKNMAVYQWKFP